jgi:hypothetical protein
MGSPDILTDGRWVGGLVRRWVPNPPPPPKPIRPRTGGRPRDIDPFSSHEACLAYAAWRSGDRSQWAIEGKRQYQREWARRKRENQRAVRSAA